MKKKALLAAALSGVLAFGSTTTVANAGPGIGPAHTPAAVQARDAVAQAITLPQGAFTRNTVFAIGMDVKSMDAEAVRTLQKTIDNMMTFAQETMGEQISDRERDEIMDGIERFAQSLRDHGVQSMAMTMDMDLGSIIREEGEPMDSMQMSFMLQADKKPDLAAIASDIMGEPLPAEATAEIDMVAMAGGWYAVSINDAPPMLRTPGRTGHAGNAKVFNEAFAHQTAGGVLQFAFRIPEEVANAASGKLAAEIPAEMPESFHEISLAIGDARMVTMSMDVTRKGIGVRSYVTFDDDRAATRMLKAYDDVQDDALKLIDTMIQSDDHSAQEKKEMRYVRKVLPDIFDLLDAKQRGNVLSYEISEENMDKLIEKVMDIVEKVSRNDGEQIEA